MQKNQFIEYLLNGASLSSVMVPNPELPSNQPAHDESYKMHFIYLDKDKFFAQTNTMHRALRSSKLHIEYHSFAYSYGYDGTMMITCPEAQKTLYGKIQGRYSKFEWIARDDFEIVWHSNQKEETGKLREAILEGKDTKLAIKDEDGYWSILPIDLININQSDNFFNVRTETGQPSSSIPDKNTLSIVLRETNQLLEQDKTKFVPATHSHIPIYYACYSDGTYYNYFDEKRSLKRKYQELRLFARKEQSSRLIRKKQIEAF